ncbi:MAG: hypothetical protein Ta2A_00740 [Treponemataceae bacterium]|nr:MAG: hypothetical protein Ta2A_00740 [Treponemataceae bacterium]
MRILECNSSGAMRETRSAWTYPAACGGVVDIFSREALIHIASSPSSKSAQAAMKKIVERFGDEIKIVNDNGSENMKDAEAYLASLNITQYWARPHTPKDKPFIERFIGTFQRGCTAQNQPRQPQPASTTRQRRMDAPPQPVAEFA